MFDQGQNRSSTLMIAYAARQTQRLWHPPASASPGVVRCEGNQRWLTTQYSHRCQISWQTKQEYHADNAVGDCTTGFAYFYNSIQGDEATSLATRR